jgi:hypothetical protein
MPIGQSLDAISGHLIGMHLNLAELVVVRAFGAPVVHGKRLLPDSFRAGWIKKTEETDHPL